MAYPTTFFASPFATDGNYTLPPATASEETPWRASQDVGFPPVTQLPVALGGVAPNRWDINGILFMLSSFAFWQQAGGMFIWSSTLDYAPPAIIYNGNTFYTCEAANGPGTSAGIRTPGTDAAYWKEFASLQGGQISLSGDVTGNGQFNASGEMDITTALTASGVTAGAYGPPSNTAPGIGGQFLVPYLTFDSKGRATGAVNRTVTLPDTNTASSLTASAFTIKSGDTQSVYAPTDASYFCWGIAERDDSEAYVSSYDIGGIYTPGSLILTMPGGTNITYSYRYFGIRVS